MQRGRSLLMCPSLAPEAGCQLRVAQSPQPNHDSRSLFYTGSSNGDRSHAARIPFTATVTARPDKSRLRDSQGLLAARLISSTQLFSVDAWHIASSRGCAFLARSCRIYVPLRARPARTAAECDVVVSVEYLCYPLCRASAAATPILSSRYIIACRLT